MGIYDFYFECTTKLQEKYGNRSIVFLKVGSFYELYGIRNSNNEYNTNIEDVSRICGIVVKVLKHVNKESTNGNTYMAGFPDYALEKFLKLVVEEDYTVAVYDQVKEDKIVTRELSQICSKGTTINNIETIDSTNNVACIWCEEYNKTVNRTNEKYIVFGLCVVNVMNGDTNVFEYSEAMIMNPTLVDELERQLTIYNPNEYIFISNLSQNQNKQILQYIGLSNTHVHVYDITNTEVLNCTKPKYISHCLNEVYGQESQNICMELNQYMMATQALVFLMEFLRSHNPHLVEKIRTPSYSFRQGYVLLANHTLKQLNIIRDNQSTGKLSNVSTFLNNCKTKSGKRLFHNNLLNPTNNVDKLNREYEMNEFYKHAYYDNGIRNIFDGIQDMELLIRHCINEKCTPQMFYTLYTSIKISEDIVNKYISCPKMSLYLNIDEINNIGDCIQYIEKHLKTEKIMDISVINHVEHNMFKKEVFERLDQLENEYEQHNNYFQMFLVALNKAVLSFDKVIYFKVNEKEKMGSTINVTKTRCEKFKKNIDKIYVMGKEILVRDINFVNTGKSIEINYPALQASIIKSQQCKDKIIDCLKQKFLEFTTDFVEGYSNLIKKITTVVSKLDVLQTRIYNSIKYNYCLPSIDSTKSDDAFVEAKEMRHCLIEHLQQNEIYVPNDITLGVNDSKGMLLYGTNAVGKTSLIRALGICVILAQSGNYVPCMSFNYNPYDSIFSRILGNDNIFKGLSTFAVEMSELRVIINNSNSKSLILGDELCSGTEMESALSIFMAGLESIHSNSSTYIFATHFHEILEFDELDGLEGLLIRHMDVYYDEKIKELVYNRKLKEGSGSKYYGLEVCKSMYMKPEFLERAYELRTTHFWENNSLLKSTLSSYNSDKLKHTCELCGKPAEDIHHMLEQHKADDNDYIGHFHKNHKANLMALCKSCHEKTHKNETEYVRKKTSRGYKVFEKSS